MVRSDRRAALRRVIGEEWYEWLEEIVALALVVPVATGALPVWTLALVALLLIRPTSRLVLLLVRGLLDPP